MILNAFKNKKIASIFVEEGKSVSALFGGFSLVLLGIPINKPPSILELVSVFISSLSAILLITLAYALTIASGLHRAKKHDSNGDLTNFVDIEPRELSDFGFFIVVSIFIFLLNIVLVCFRVHWAAGLGSISALVVLFFAGRYIDRPPRLNI